MSYLKTYNKLMEQYQGTTAYSQQELEDIIADLSGLLDNPATKLTREQIVTKLKGYINMLNNTPENLNNLAYLAQGEDEETIAESKKKAKKDACYHKAKAKYDVFPSAYASGYISRCRKRKGKIK
jgi:hypothetical protein